MRFISIARSGALIVALALIAPQVEATNLLENGDFESPAMGGSPGAFLVPPGAPWYMQVNGGTNPTTIVRVDGSPLIHPYATWPWLDGDVGEGQYFHLKNGNNIVLPKYAGNDFLVQEFTVPCDGQYSFGYSLNSKSTNNAIAKMIIRLSGTNIASTGNNWFAQGTPDWQVHQATTTLASGQPYEVVLNMAQFAMIDNVFVRKVGEECVGDPIDFDIKDDHFQCYSADGEPLNVKVSIADQFGSTIAVLGRPVMHCNPSSKKHNGGSFPIIDGERHEVCYEILEQSNPAAPQFLEVTSQFGKQKLDTFGRNLFCAPSAKSHSDRPKPLSGGEHFQCYTARGDAPKKETLSIKDQFGGTNATLGNAVLHCNPSAKKHNNQSFSIIDNDRHLVCYRYEDQGGVQSYEVAVLNQFGLQKIRTGERTLFCAPSLKKHR